MNARSKWGRVAAEYAAADVQTSAASGSAIINTAALVFCNAAADHAVIERQCRMIIVDTATLVIGEEPERSAVHDAQVRNGNSHTNADVKDSTLGVAIHSEVLSTGP